MLDLLSGILARWRGVAGLMIAATVLAVAVSLLLPARYRSTARFVPETTQASLPFPGELAGIASRLGISLPAAGASPAFYSDIVRSRTLTDELLRSRFPDPRVAGIGDSVALLDLLKVRADRDDERLEKGRRKLASDVRVTLARETGVVSVSVTTRYPTLSAAVANRLVSLVTQFDVATRRTTARETREFIEQRLPDAETELADAESELQRFLERNREFRGSPQLEFARARLQRRVDLKQQILTTLRQNYEQVRIQEVNDTPVLTIVDAAIAPVKRSSPRRKLIVGLVLGFAIVAGVGGASVATVFALVRADEPARAAALDARWRAFRGDLVRVVLPFRRSR
jgi:uncharacterized protein involved in exopolysaccharide biosynthesis